MCTCYDFSFVAFENLYSPHMVVKFNKNGNGTKTNVCFVFAAVFGE